MPLNAYGGGGEGISVTLTLPSPPRERVKVLCGAFQTARHRASRPNIWHFSDTLLVKGAASLIMET